MHMRAVSRTFSCAVSACRTHVDGAVVAMTAFFARLDAFYAADDSGASTTAASCGMLVGPLMAPDW